MSSLTLTVLDTPGIQPYIFGSNRLRENIGASELVSRATAAWPLQVLGQMGHSNVENPAADAPAERLNDRSIEDEGQVSEVVYVGGGNAVILFRQEGQARQFTTCLNRKMLQEAPGLELAVAHVGVDWESDHLRDRVDAAMQQLARYKQSRRPALPLQGLGVTAACRSTGLAATTTNAEHGRAPGAETFPISTEVAAKLDRVKSAHERLRALFLSDDLRRAGCDFPLDFDEFGRSRDEMSYIAVVHADGNNMGRFFRKIAEDAPDSRSYVRKMREASNQVNQAALVALQRVITDLFSSIDPDNQSIGGVVPVRDGKLPLRPLVFGGDDVTFVCDGRLGLTLAARYLEAFEQEAQSRGMDLHAAAGIAVVKTHYPFARAYQLSESLAKSAKRYVHDQNAGDFAALDWHFAASGLMGGLDDIRRREYTMLLDERRHNLYMRPLRLKEQAGKWRTWPNFSRAVTTFQEQWGERRNKVIALREALREGPEAVRRFLAVYGETLPELDKSLGSFQESGWFGQSCGYFDAIEALDFYVPLRGEER